jgi:signal transduction histidine kinase
VIQSTSRPYAGSMEERIFFIERRVYEKIDDYENYSFNSVQDCALKTFFDLAQELESQRDFYCMCVMVPKIFFNLKSVLYVVRNENTLAMVSHSEDLYHDPPRITVSVPTITHKPTVIGGSYFSPVKGNEKLLSALPQVPERGILGVIEIYPASELTEHMMLFFEKFANRIGFQLHNRFITEKNKEHLRFINNLVSDIGHNVIVPNMYFKLFFRRLKGKIDRAREIGLELKRRLDVVKQRNDPEIMREVIALQEELHYINESMEEQFEQILNHYEHTSLFLETLLRRSHFEQGRYVLEPTRANFKERIIRPQLNRYLPRLEERRIAVDDQLGGIPDEEITVVADAGLISQVYANLFTNAIKYTREVVDQCGTANKFIALGMEILKNHFGDGKDGIKFNLFSTGPHIPAEDVPNLFKEGYRGGNVGDEYGTGHGLIFIKEVVELHGGTVGYEPTHMGNNFYFILPK